MPNRRGPASINVSKKSLKISSKNVPRFSTAFPLFHLDKPLIPHLVLIRPHPTPTYHNYSDKVSIVQEWEKRHPHSGIQLLAALERQRKN